MKMLVMGLPGSGKTTLAKPFADLLDAAYFNGDQIRARYDDHDFSLAGREYQAERMKYLCDGALSITSHVVADFICPTKKTREIFKPDFTIWMDTIKESEYEDTNTFFERPSKVDYHVDSWFDDTHRQLVQVVERFMRSKNV